MTRAVTRLVNYEGEVQEREKFRLEKVNRGRGREKKRERDPERAETS